MAYICSTLLDITTKIYILIGVLSIGMTGFYVIEIIEKLGGLRKSKDGEIIPIDRLFSRKRDEFTLNK